MLHCKLHNSPGSPGIVMATAFAPLSPFGPNGPSLPGGPWAKYNYFEEFWSNNKMHQNGLMFERGLAHAYIVLLTFERKFEHFRSGLWESMTLGRWWNTVWDRSLCGQSNSCLLKWEIYRSVWSNSFRTVFCVTSHHHHHQFNIQFLLRWIKGMDGCFPTARFIKFINPTHPTYHE